MGNGNRDREEERTLLGDLPRGWPKPRSILEYDEIPFDLFLNMMRFHFMMEDLLSDWQNWKLTFISTRFLIKVGLVTCKLFYGVRELWFEFLDFRTCIDMSLIHSWQDLRQSLILKFIQDDYEEILY